MIGALKQVLLAKKLKYKYKKVHTRLDSIDIASDVKIGKWCSVSKRVILGAEVEIGDFTYLNASKYWTTVESKVKIGKYCSIAPGVHIGAGNHDMSFVTTHPILFDRYYLPALTERAEQRVSGLADKEKETTIGNDVWIGLGAVIKRGVAIGDGAVIAADSVVVKDVPAYAVVGGNPAKVIKYRTSEENIAFFEKHREMMWWNWDEKTLSSDMSALYDFETYRKLLENKIR